MSLPTTHCSICGREFGAEEERTLVSWGAAYCKECFGNFRTATKKTLGIDFKKWRWWQSRWWT